MCAAMLRFLVSRGAMLAAVTPELLLPVAEFRQWRLAQLHTQLEVSCCPYRKSHRTEWLGP